jgi:hypothetical protein
LIPNTAYLLEFSVAYFQPANRAFLLHKSNGTFSRLFSTKREYSPRYLVQLLGFENALCWRAKRAYGTQTQQALIPTAEQDDVSCG